MQDRKEDDLALSWRKRLAFILVCLAGMPLIALLLIEGGSSWVMFIHEVLFGDEHRVADRLYTQYDSALGWVNRPHATIPDAYGPGVGVRTNGQGFRHDGEVTAQVAAGRVRVLCSGDSFTFGYGVSDAETWCSQLAAQDSVYETVNLGVVGYGVDQMYLRFLRDAAALDHHVHVVAFIGHDFKRMGLPVLLGSDKPLLSIRGEDLVVENTPVPRQWFTPAWLRRAEAAMPRLRTAELLRRSGIRPRPARDPGRPDTVIWRTAQATFAALQRQGESAGAPLVLVYLPSRPDYDSTDSPLWRQQLSAFTAARGIRYVDLAAESLELPRDSLQMFFRPVDGHYTSQGQRWIAERLGAFLKTVVSMPGRTPARPACASWQRSYR